ncbi:MAG: hypothetical protein HUJ94_03370 [Bacteroidales bacterium]|nr:hypothetical protein [Bacteroidales bacterium]
MKIRNIILAFMLALVSQLCPAQFYTSGDDPGRIRWSVVESPSFRIVYPEGLDSLAMAYGRKLEYNKLKVGASAGYYPGENIRSKMPVVLHAFTAESNGSVAWAPKRMDLYTTPEPNVPEAIGWTDLLTIHESRHAAQMQFGLSNKFKPMKWVLGEMFNGFTCIYPGQAFLEGDAVVAETALSSSGRGRTASFLNRYRIAFDNGDFKNWAKWRTGSMREEIPNHYALGYTLLSGMRYFYDADMYMAETLDYASRHPLDPFLKNKVTKEHTGMGLRKTFADIALKYNEMWQQEAEARAPWTETDSIIETPERYTTFTSLTAAHGGMYAIRRGMALTSEIVFISDSGEISTLCPFSSGTGKIEYTAGKIWWGENVNDPRWTLEGSSSIRYMDPADGKKHTLIKGEKLFNPTVCSDGSLLAVAYYAPDARTRLRIYSTEDGSLVRSFPACDSLQLVQFCWKDSEIYASALSEKGYGLYRMEDDGAVCVMSPRPYRIGNPFYHEGRIYFTGEYTGVEELWSLNLGDGSISRHTSNRHGAAEFCFAKDGSLWMGRYEYAGTMPRKCNPDRLSSSPLEEPFRYRVADRLSEQEKAYAVSETTPESVDFTSPRHYGKFVHALNVHSWAPLFVAVDDIMDASFDYQYNTGVMGVTLLSQNLLGTVVSNLGYSVHKDFGGAPAPESKVPWRNSLHWKMTCTAFYPVIEAQVDFNDRLATYHSLVNNIYEDGSQSFAYTASKGDKPYLKCNLKVYVPLDFSSGGWQRGMIPSISLNVSNDVYSASGMVRKIADDIAGGGHMIGLFKDYEESGNHILTTMSASARAYIMLPRAKSAVYPRWGIGVEAGYSTPSEPKLMSSSAYFYAYGYVPGITRLQGFKLSAMLSSSVGKDPLFRTLGVNTLPRGLSDNSQLFSHITRESRNSALVKTDYAIPVYMGDICLGGTFLNIQRMVITPHFDCCFCGEGCFYSTGAAITFNLGSAFWITSPVSAGITASYNGGGGFSRLSEKREQLKMDHYYVGPVFSVSF